MSRPRSSPGGLARDLSAAGWRLERVLCDNGGESRAGLRRPARAPRRAQDSHPRRAPADQRQRRGASPHDTRRESWRPAFACYLYVRLTPPATRAGDLSRLLQRRSRPPRTIDRGEGLRRRRLRCPQNGGEMRRGCRHISGAVQGLRRWRLPVALPSTPAAGQLDLRLGARRAGATAERDWPRAAPVYEPEAGSAVPEACEVARHFGEETVLAEPARAGGECGAVPGRSGYLVDRAAQAMYIGRGEREAVSISAQISRAPPRSSAITASPRRAPPPSICRSPPRRCG